MRMDLLWGEGYRSPSSWAPGSSMAWLGGEGGASVACVSSSAIVASAASKDANYRIWGH
jgi:hypothetical protein